MLITKHIAQLVNESRAKDSKKLLKPQKEIQTYLKLRKLKESKPKKHEQFLENDFFCSLGFIWL